MVETKHSFAERRTVPLSDASVTHRTNCRSGYLRRPKRIAGEGCRLWLGVKTTTRLVAIRGRIVPIAAVLIAAVAIGPTLEKTAAAAQLDAATVQRSIDRGIAYLRKSQNERGGWEEFGGQSCGLSALCTLAFMNSGVSKEDDAIVRAMRYLRAFEPNETYSVALQTLVYCQLGAAGDLPRIRRNVEWLVANQKRSGSADRIGSWDYGAGRGSGDPSNAQFALLALGAAQDRGIDVDPDVFQRSLDYWVNRQRDDGGWAYGGGRRNSGSMTCAGIASTIIARGRLGGENSQASADQIRCCGNQLAGKDPVEAALGWLGRNFTLQVNPGGDSMTRFYYFYALERVGRLSGRRFIGDHDWYREGAEVLLDLQDEFVGFWSGAGPMENRDVATSFALLFLSKGKRQVVVGRMKYSDPQVPRQWQEHPDSLRQLVRHVEREWGRDLTWQTVDAEKAQLEDLLQTPVLVISGRRPLRMDPEVVDRLKQYIDQGGCILFEADGGDGCGDASGFEASVGRLCESWFEGAKLERLPPSHPIWFAQRKVDPTSIGPTSGCTVSKHAVARRSSTSPVAFRAAGSLATSCFIVTEVPSRFGVKSTGQSALART